MVHKFSLAVNDNIVSLLAVKNVFMINVVALVFTFVAVAVVALVSNMIHNFIYAGYFYLLSRFFVRRI